MSQSTVSVNYKGVDLTIEYHATPYHPAVNYLSNGDPGYPEEGGDFDILHVWAGKTEITSMLSDDQFDEIEESIMSRYSY